MNRIKISAKDKDVMKLIKAAYPAPKCRKYCLAAMTRPMELDSYWSEGSKNYYKFVDVNTLKVVEVQSNNPVYERGRPRQLNSLPLHVALVEETIFCGKHISYTVYVNPNILPKYIEGE